MINLLKAVIGLLVMILVAIATAWVNGVNEDRLNARKDLDTLILTEKYLHGEFVMPTMPVTKKSP